MSVPGSTRVTLLDQGRCRANMVGFNTIVIREFSRIIRIWGQTLVPPAITATLYFVIFGSLIGGLKETQEMLDYWCVRAAGEVRAGAFA